ncbi:MAG: glycosyltransferase family 1 protein [Candidatus Saccharimonadales bacterium]
MITPKHIVIDARNRRSSTGRYTDRLIEHLQSIDTFHRYTILVQPDDQWKMKGKNFTTLPCPYAQFSVNPMEQIGFYWQLKKLHPDLVHFTMTQQPLLYFGKIVTTTHDLTMFHFVRRGSTPLPIFWVKMGLYRFLLKWSHMKSDKIITPTKFVADDVANYQPSTKGKLVVTYESAEPAFAAKAVRPKQIGEKDQFIMYLGNAFPHKNLAVLFDALDILRKKRPDLKLVLVGKKEINYQELEAKAQNHPSARNIIFTGFIPDEEAKWLHEHSLAYVFPSLSEGFSLTPMEAIVHGSPVVASNATCMPEVYQNAAHYFDAHYPKDIAAKTAEVIDNKKLRDQLIKNGQELVKKYSWRKMANETLIVYKEVLGETTDA